MNELVETLVGDSAATPPDRVLHGLDEELAHRATAGSPHTIYEEVWHLAFWQQVTLDWINGIDTPCPEHASHGFPGDDAKRRENWETVRHRFLEGTQLAASVARDEDWLKRAIQCPSPPGKPTRTMTVREQLESLTAHNAYHIGRVVLLRQINNSWPPAAGGFTW
jgi:uncharacterized damage-inducible protein DinB